MRSDVKALKRVSARLYREARRIKLFSKAPSLEWHANGMYEAALMCAREARKIEKARKR